MQLKYPKKFKLIVERFQLLKPSRWRSEIKALLCSYLTNLT